MSKIGKKSIVLPEGVKVSPAGLVLTVKGPGGEIKLNLHPVITVAVKDKEVQVTVRNPQEREQKELWGTFRSLVQNAIIGVSEGFEKRLEVVGVGYRAEVSNDDLALNLGYSHPVKFKIPDSLEVKVEKNVISIRGIDKQLVGEFAALVRAARKPEPYKGKGIRYDDEIVRRKAGKVVKAVGGAAGAG